MSFRSYLELASKSVGVLSGLGSHLDTAVHRRSTVSSCGDVDLVIHAEYLEMLVSFFV